MHLPPTRLRRAPLVALLVAAGLVLGACSKDAAAPTDQPASTTVSVDLGCNPAVAAYPNKVAYAKEIGALAVYDAPDGAPMTTQTFENPRLTDSNPPVSVDLVFLVKNEPKDNCDWLEVYLPIRPNGSTGWVKRDDIRLEGNRYRIVVNLNEFSLKAYDGDDVLLDTQIGVARDNAPTPGGLYYTTELLATGDDSSPYGPWAFGLSGFSETLTSFNGGQGQLGIHGTNQPDKIGQKVSSGCIRLRNEDIVSLVDSLKVFQGIPVTVNA